MVKAYVDQADESAHHSATVYGGLKSGGVGLGLALAASIAAQRFHVQAYHRLTLPLKAFAITSATTASFIIGADAASRKFELSKYATGSGTALEAETHRTQMLEREAGIFQSGKRKVDTRNLSTRDAIVEWSKEHRYGVVFGAWAASMVGSFGYISMTPLSFAQKLVQARMVAQGLTVVVLIASAGLSSIPTAANGQNDEEIQRDEREQSMFKWKKGSPHDIASHNGDAKSE